MSTLKPIFDISSFSAIDFPDNIAGIVWFVGCNMRCKYCYNPQIVNGKGVFSYDDVYSFLKKRKGLLDGVVLSGGECTSHSSIFEFATKIKELGFKLKIDTNGSNPIILKEMINKSLIDYVALDFKTLSNNFEELTSSNLFSQFERTLRLLLSSYLDFEVRTTVITNPKIYSELMDMTNYLVNIGYKKTYYLQQAKTDIPTIGNIQNSFPHINLKQNDFINFPLDIKIRT